MKDALGNRIKEQYENRTRYLLPRRTYTIIRVDGKAFHSYTRGCKRPFDEQLMADMDATAKAMCEQMMGAQIAYVQSDEITVLLTDFNNEQTEAFFDGNVQKLASISASIATAAFNQRRDLRVVSDLISALEDYSSDDYAHKSKLLNKYYNLKKANFDSRVFTVPDPTEVANCLIWRMQDCVRNSISMVAQANFSHNELQNKSSNEMQEMLFQKGINWNDFPDGCKHGRCIIPVKVLKPVEYFDKRTNTVKTSSDVERNEWQIVAPPTFTKDRDWLNQYIPRYS